jgi:Uma2 family endonuclease
VVRAPRHAYSFDEYLELEASSATKHEYYDGEIFAMAGGTPWHAQIAIELAVILRPQLRDGPCRMYSSDLRVRVLETGLATYPDSTIACGPEETDPDSKTTLTNPRVVFEITSDGTETYDRTDKVDHYRRIPSLEACVIIAHRERAVDVHRRDGDGWHHARFGPGDTIELGDGWNFSVDALYSAASSS